MQTLSVHEMKRHQARTDDGAGLAATLDQTNKRTRLMKQDLLRSADKWGRQLPSRVLTSVLSCAGALEIARSQIICDGWGLPANLLDRLWRMRYELDWEAE